MHTSRRVGIGFYGAGKIPLQGTDIGTYILMYTYLVLKRQEGIHVKYIVSKGIRNHCCARMNYSHESACSFIVEYW